MEFLVTRGDPGHYDAEIHARRSAVIPCELTSNPARFARRLLAVLRERGPYDVVHSHVHHFSGFILALARLAGIPVRIAHSHLDTQRLDAESGLRRRLYVKLMSAALHLFATHGLAVSGPAAAALFGPRWRDDDRWAISRCGLDFGAFRERAEVSSVRAELGLPADALVLGHVGRFELQKNHALLVKIAAAAFRRDPSVFLVLVGDGPLRASVEADAASLGIRERIAFAGIRADVPRVLRAFDVFVFPSVREGLPLVGLEAQAAGLPIVLSDSITRELVVIPELFTWRSPADSPESWADAVLAAARGPAPVVDAVAALEWSEFSLSQSLPALLEVYRQSA
jgi:glycosyltransferase involved in cell wall biosynthesis